jgi:hypothetical protein
MHAFICRRPLLTRYEPVHRWDQVCGDIDEGAMIACIIKKKHRPVVFFRGQVGLFYAYMLELTSACASHINIFHAISFVFGSIQMRRPRLVPAFLLIF